MNIEIFRKFKAATFSRKAAFSEIRTWAIVVSLLIAMKFEKKKTLIEIQSLEEYLFLCDGGNHSCS